MFGLGKNNSQQNQDEQNSDKSKKQKSNIDKLVMGTIMGVAVGSVIGMSIAPKKGKETRELIGQKGKDAYEKGKEMMNKGFFAKLKDKLSNKKESTTNTTSPKEANQQKETVINENKI